MSDCLVIGGGVIGMMSARVLALSGAKVTLIDQRECGKESSWAGGGIISPLYPWEYDELTNELSFKSQAVYAALCDDLQTSTGINPEYQKSGLLMMDKFDTPEAQTWMQRHKIDYQSCADGALFAHIASVRNPRLLQALKADIIKQGVKIIEHTQVEQLIYKGERVLGVQSSKGELLTDTVIACAGAWSSQLLELSNKVFPIKGQMIVLQANIGDVSPIILDQGRYIIPRSDGKVVVGSSMEDVGFNRETDAQTKASLHKFAYQHIPRLKNAKIEHHWSGFRPATRTAQAIIAKDEKYRNLFINTGHFRNGLNMAPASAQKIAGLVNAN
ncbi:Glycine oxidase ThiO [uncultured Candidatus Thioglobus sp.]|nr:Glycine oxidase ThiO [uncultured Candidatus Thioglobus sp.]